MSHRHDRRFPFGQRASQTGLGGRGPAAEGLEGGVLQGGVGLDAQMPLQLFHIDGLAGARADIEGQTFDLLPHQAALAGQAADEPVQGVAGQSDLVGGQGLARHPGHVARLVLIAGDADRALRGFGGLAQGGVPSECASLDHQHGVRIVAALGVNLERGGEQLVDRGLLRPQPDAHQTPPADHRQGRQGLLQPRLVAVDVAVGQQGDVEGIVQVGRDRLAEDLGALPDARPVLAVDDRGADAPVRRLEETIDFRAFGQDHRAWIMAGPKAPASGRAGSDGPVRRRRAPRRPAGPRWRQRAGRRRHRWW